MGATNLDDYGIVWQAGANRYFTSADYVWKNGAENTKAVAVKVVMAKMVPTEEIVDLGDIVRWPTGKPLDITLFESPVAKPAKGKRAA